MEKRLITLSFNNTITRVAGYDYGVKKFKEIENEIDWANGNIIVFPDNIEILAISFVQGFINSLLNKISVDEFQNKFEIKGKETLVKRFNKAVRY